MGWWATSAQALKDNPPPFMTRLAKLLPLMVEGSKDAPIIVERVLPVVTPIASTKIRIPNNWRPGGISGTSGAISNRRQAGDLHLAPSCGRDDVVLHLARLEHDRQAGDLLAHAARVQPGSQGDLDLR